MFFVPYTGSDLSEEVLILQGYGPVIVQVNSPEVAELIGKVSVFRLGWGGQSWVDYYSLTKEQKKTIQTHLYKLNSEACPG